MDLFASCSDGAFEVFCDLGTGRRVLCRPIRFGCLLLHQCHKLLVYARSDGLRSAVPVDGLIASVPSRLRHGSIAVCPHRHQHPESLFLLGPPLIHHRPVLLVQQLRVRQRPAQTLHVQGDGAPLPLLRYIETQRVHLCRTHATHVQRFRRSPERTAVVLQLPDFDVQLAHGITPFFPSISSSRRA